ncbi:MAG: phosphate ABC transporter substrate-binding protein [Desulfuromonadaceae bacterium]|nr:phosphate ABC transporter substrate-binding protein [Desulfuromonadaceae bacterium]MDD5104542.1 phosphate ABC transporter substrate-binding protein [Desulfuromonadaceae bacterium]
MFKKSIMTAALLTVTAVAAHAAPTHVDVKIATYKSTAGVAGNLNSIGSDTLNNLMTYWAEGFKKKYPNVNIQIEGKGSTTAPPALIAGTAQLGPMSREMKSSEIEGFEKKYGYKPTKIGVALDSLAVFVNKDNPIKSLSLDEVDAIFSSTHKRGLADITTWGQLGVTGKLAAKPISLYGRNSASGTYGYFKEHTLKKGDYKSTVKEQPGSASVVEGVAHDISAIGYSGIGYATSGVRAIALSDKMGSKAEAANYENVLSGKYPLSRMLYIYVAKKPGEPLPKVVEEFLKFALSKEGQEIVVKDGYDPLTAKLVAAQLKALK